MNEIEQLRAAYAALLAMVNSTDPDVKASATALCAKLKEQAATLGIDLDAAPEDTDPVVDDAAVADAALPAKAPVVAPVAKATAARALSLADVQTAIRAENAKRDLLALAATNREGMTPTLVTVLASKSLAEVRSIVGAMPLKTVAAPPGATTTTVTAGAAKVPPAQLAATAGAGAVDGAAHADEDAMSATEAADVEKMRRQIGVSPLAVTAAKEQAAKGTLGVLSIARIREMKAAGKAATAAKVAAAK